MVASFEPSVPVEVDQAFIDHTFNCAKDRAQTLFSEIKLLPLAPERERGFATLAASGLASSRVGVYSKMHDKAIFRNGYDHKDTRELQWM
jgi:hypothetical protein